MVRLPARHLRSCRRKYFYSYYASNDDPEIQRLKKLSALPLWAGSVVHETIENFLKTHDTIPPRTEQEAIIRAAVHERMLGEWKESEAGSLRFRLFEHEYQTPIERRGQEDRRGHRDALAAQLLQERRPARGLRRGRAQLAHRRGPRLLRGRRRPVFLRMDLAFRDPTAAS